MSQQNQPTPLQATERDSTLNPRQLRTAGFIPSTLYGVGANAESRSIQVRTKEFTTLYAKGIRIFELSGLNPKVVARAHKLQVDSVSQTVLSAEFMQIAASEVSKAMKADAAAMEKARAQAEAAVEGAVAEEEKAPVNA